MEKQRKARKTNEPRRGGRFHRGGRGESRVAGRFHREGANPGGAAVSTVGGGIQTIPWGGGGGGPTADQIYVLAVS